MIVLGVEGKVGKRKTKQTISDGFKKQFLISNSIVDSGLFE